MLNIVPFDVAVLEKNFFNFFSIYIVSLCKSFKPMRQGYNSRGFI